jgi:GAF domain-containing protein/PAS domain-containing protein
MVETPSSSTASPPSAASARPSYVEEGLYYLLAWSERVFDLVPDAIGILDDSFRVRAANAAFLEFFGFESLNDARGTSLESHPLFASAFTAAENGAPLAQLLRDQLETGTPLSLDRIRFADDASITDEISIRSLPWDLENARSRRILLWIRRDSRAAASPEEVSAAAFEETHDRLFTLQTFLEKLLEALPLGVCLLDPSLRVVVENEWIQKNAGANASEESGNDRHLFSLYPSLRDDRLQSALELCRSSGESQSLVLLAADGRPNTLLVDLHACLPDEDTQGVLILVRDAAPVVAPASDGPERSASPAASRPAVAPLPLQPEPTRPHLVEIESIEAAEGTLDPAAHRLAPGAVKTVILLGASHADVPVLRLLYRSPGVRIRMIFDPDPEAFGLSLGRSLGIPVLSGDLQVQLESLPDAVVIARSGLEKHLERLGLEVIPRIARDETELFLVDPEAFLSSEGSVFEAIPMEERAEPVEREGRRTKADPVAHPPAPAHAPAPVAAPIAAAPAALDVNAEVQSILRALDLLLDFQKLADWVLESALRLLNAGSGSLMLLQEEKPILSIVASRGLRDIALRNRRQRVGEGIAGRVAEDGEPILRVGTVGETNLKPMGPRPEIRSSISVPVVADSGIVGVLNLNSDPAGKNFDSHDLERVREFGRQLGGALSRSMHLRKLRTHAFEQSMCGEIAAIGETHSDLGMKLRQVAERIVRVLNADSCSIYLMNREKDALNLEASSGVSTSANEAVSVPLGTGVVGWVAKSRRPLVLRNPDEEVGDPLPTTLAFPIRHQTDLLGVLTIEAAQQSTSEEDRMGLMEAISTAIGSLISGVLSAQLSERKVTMLSAISELGLAFGAASHRKGLARLVAFTASTVLESHVGLVRLRQRDGLATVPEIADLELLASHGASIPGEAEPLCILESALLKRAMETGHPCRDLDLPLAESETLLRQSNVFAAMAVPITNSSHVVVGSIMVCRVADPSGKGSSFGTSEMEMATRISDYAGAAAVKFSGQSGDDGKEESEEE